MAAKINSALTANGYTSAEAHASVCCGPTAGIWVKEVKPGISLQRIYLNGKKTNGYVHFVDEKWEAEGISFMSISRIVGEIIVAENKSK